MPACRFEPLWDLAIRSRRVVHALPLLEAVLTGFGRNRPEHTTLSAETTRLRDAA
jgi:hypothetical protein